MMYNNRLIHTSNVKEQFMIFSQLLGPGFSLCDLFLISAFKICHDYWKNVLFFVVVWCVQ